MITYEDFAKLDLRVAKIIAVEKVENTQKLYKIKIDLGGEERQIISGLAEKYAPEELTGKLIIVLANLEPKTIKGQESNGMLLAASENDQISLLTIDKLLPSGSKIS